MANGRQNAIFSVSERIPGLYARDLAADTTDGKP
jgi:hypothetical protein